MSKSSSKLKIILPIIIIVPIIAIIVFMSNLEKVVSGILSQALNSKVTVQKIDLNLLEGQKLSVMVKDIRIANMPGYTDSDIMTISSVKAEGGLADDKSIALDEVSMDGLNVYFEANTNGTNIKDMMSNIRKNGSKGDDTQKTTKADNKDQGKIAIKKTSFTNGQIHARLLGMEKTIKLPSQTISNIGRDNQKISYQDAAQQFMTQIMANASKAAASLAVPVNVDKDAIKGSLKKGLGGLLK